MPAPLHGVTLTLPQLPSMPSCVGVDGGHRPFGNCLEDRSFQEAQDEAEETLQLRNLHLPLTPLPSLFSKGLHLRPTRPCR